MSELEDEALGVEHWRRLPPIARVLLALGVNHLHYLAPLPIIGLIAANGILSFNLRRKTLQALEVLSIADPDVQSRRTRRTIDGKPLHDYVPLYFGIHTPFQYVNVQKDFAGQENLVFVEVDMERIFGLDGVLYTNGNAAADQTTFYSRENPDGVSQIDWIIVLKESRCYSSDYKHKKCAEVLVPERIPPDFVRRYAVLNLSAAVRLQLAINTGVRNGWIKQKEIRVECDPSHFYSWRNGRPYPNA